MLEERRRRHMAILYKMLPQQTQHTVLNEVLEVRLDKSGTVA
jgi:hypothetical protein